MAASKHFGNHFPCAALFFRMNQITPHVLCALGLALVAGCAREAPAATSAAANPPPPPPTCRVTGPTLVVSDDTYTEQLHVTATGPNQFDVGLLDGVAPCLDVRVNGEGERLGTILGECAPPASRKQSSAANAVTTYVARESRDVAGRPRLMIGFVDYEPPHAMFGVAAEGRSRVVEHALAVPRGVSDEGSPVLANVGERGFAFAWLQGGSVRVQRLGGRAELLGAPTVVTPPDARDPRGLAMAFDPSGRGLVVYAAQNEDKGQDVLATP